MARVLNSVASALADENDRSREALMGNGKMIPIDVPIPLALTTNIEILPNLVDENVDGDVSKLFSNSSSSTMSTKSNSNSNHLEELFHLIDYKNTRSKLAFFKQQKSTRSDKVDKNSSIEPIQLSGNSRRKGNGQGKKVFKKMEEIYGDEGDSEIDGTGHPDRNQDSKKVVEASSNLPKRSSKKNIRSNALSSFISHPQSKSRQDSRGSKSAMRSIGSKSMRSIATSSTSSTKKKSNSDIKSSRSVNDLMRNNNSSWADGVRKNSEPAERRMRRTRRRSYQNVQPNASGDNQFHQQHSNYHWVNNAESSNKKSVRHPSTVGRFARRRSLGSGDVNAITPSNPGSRSKLRRNRHSISGGAGVDVDMLTSLASPISCPPKMSNAATLPPASTASTAEHGFVTTPYNVLRDPKFKSKSRSYSDLVMIATDSSKTPMASLRKHLRIEKELSLSNLGDTNEGPCKIGISEVIKGPGQTPDMSENVPQILLQIPFSDGITDTHSCGKRGDYETDNNKKSLVVQAFGKSVAKSMKKQAKTTKRKISRQISKMAPAPQAPKSAKPSSSISKSHVLLDDTDISSLQLFDADASGSSPQKGTEDDESVNNSLKPPSGHFLLKNNKNDERHNDPMLALKPPSGHRGWGESSQCSFQAAISKKIESSIQHGNRRLLPPPLIPGSEINHSKESAGLIVGNDPKRGDGKKSRKKTRSKPNRKSHKKQSQSNSKKKNDEQLESSLDLGDANLKCSGQDSSSHHFSLYESGILDSTSDDNFPVFDDEEGDSSIETNSKIDAAKNQKVNLKEQTAIGESNVKDDHDKVGSTRHTTSTHDVSIADGLEQEDQSGTHNSHLAPTSAHTEPMTSSPSRPIVCQQIDNSCDPNNSTISTVASSVPTPSSRNRSKKNSEKTYDKQNQNDEIQIDRKPIINSEKSKNQPPKNKGTLGRMVAPVREEAKGKKSDKNANTPFVSFRGVQISIKEAETRPNDLALELFGLLENKISKRASREKGHKQSSKERITDRHKKALRRMKEDQHIIDMDINVDTDPLNISEISSPLRSTQRKKSAKPRRSTVREISPRGGDVQPPTTTKDRKTKSRRRGSKMKNRHELDISKMAEQLVYASGEDRSDSMKSIDKMASQL